MQTTDRKAHWENIYNSKKLEEVSWYEPTPATSLSFISRFNIAKTAKIIDIGGGDSLFVDHLLEAGFTDITVLDISEAALTRAKQRLGVQAHLVKWIVSDIADFKPTEKYDFWHDRAAFHFLTDEKEIYTYINMVSLHLSANGILVLGTFSEQGPTKCSGIEIKQYSENAMVRILEKYFDKVVCKEVEHTTPFNTIQKFIFCSFRKK
jgi:2-polyprenyl-3-methyl-5-hydroxy-6-metoxy-1,4-benzoquinol methylase